MKQIFAYGILFLVVGCDGASNATKQVSSSPSFNSYPLNQVFDRIKLEIGLFNADDVATRNNWQEYLLRLDALNGCSGNQKLKFQITKIKMTFQIVKVRTTSVNGSAKIPIPLVLSSVDPKLTFSHENTDTQEITYYYYPGDTAYIDSNFKRENAIILNDLDALRDGIILAGKQQPCFHNTDKDSKDENSLTFGVSIVTDTQGNLGVEFVPAGLNVGGGYENKSTTGNTIVVTFKPVNG